MRNSDAMTPDPQAILVRPGATCRISAGGRHRGVWHPGEVVELHPTTTRTTATFLCKLCGLTVSVQIDVFSHTPGDAAALAGWEYPGDNSDAN